MVTRESSRRMDDLPTWSSQTDPRLVLCLRLVVAGMLIGLLWKISFFLVADQLHFRIPIRDAFFPKWLQNAQVLRAAFLTSVIFLGTTLATASAKRRKICLPIALAANSVLLVHQGSYNDMTFVTVWWCNVWACWFAWRMSVDSSEALLRKSALVSRAILSLVLLGGAAGKWTQEYWSGEVFYEIYFRERDFWLFNLLRSTSDTQSLRVIATYYSQMVVLLETIGGLTLWCLPRRMAAIVGATVFSAIALMSNFWLFSVLGPLIGLSLVGLVGGPTSRSKAASRSLRSVGPWRSVIHSSS